MSYPELYSDERVVLQAQNVKVKSVSFEVVLTTRRLVLIDTKKHSIPPQEINLATLKDVESGENAIRDPTITISIITISGNTRQMVLTFSKTSGGERRRESEDWVRALRQNITTTVHLPVSQPAPRTEKAPEPSPSSQPPSPPQPPAQAPHRIEITNAPPPKKRIEIARPMKKIVESAPAMPVPIETSSLPTGSFCNRCGNRVPPESAFCNRCGTPVIHDTGSGYLPPEEVRVPPQPPAPPVQQVYVPVPQAPASAADTINRPIEQVIHSIEPLIEDSVPRTVPAPLIPSRQVHYEQPAEPAEPAGQVPQPVTADTPAEAGPPGNVQWPVLSKSGIPDIPLPSAPGAAPSAPAAAPSAPAAAPSAPVTPGTLPPSPPRKVPVKMIAVLAFIILAVIAGVYIFMQQPSVTPVVSPTPEPTVPATTQATPVPTAATTAVPETTPRQVTTAAALIPQTGVWVKVTYPNKYSGTVGTPGRLRDVSDSGEHLYQIPTTQGPVVATIRKYDGSTTPLVIDIYKDGVLVKHVSTTAPMGTLEVQTGLLNPVTTTTTAAP
ncbi:MAG: hypothetical protein LUQ19_03745 [Methanoregula sp.]|nr:hypothetical protein [Methanoregula sp.]